MSRRKRRLPGVLERTARGEGHICPACRTFVKPQRDGTLVCGSCGRELKVEVVESSVGKRRR